MIKSNWPNHLKNEIEAVKNVLKSSKTNYWSGLQCKKFEDIFSQYNGTKYGVAVSNGSLALDAAVEALNLKKNDEIIVTPRSYMSSASCIVRNGCIPKFVDVNIDTQNIDPINILNAINKKTKAIICVHLAGLPCDMHKILKIAKKFKLKVIEDCSQAHGAMIDGKKVGSFGDISTWSFCYDKIISTGGEGGFIATNNKKLWKKIWSIKDIGKDYDSVFKKKHKEGFKWFHDHIGTNMRMTEMQAVIGILQLNKLDQMIKRRNFLSNKIWKTVSKYSCFRYFKLPKNIRFAGYRCYVFVNSNFLKKNWSRKKIIIELNKKGINCKSGSCPEIYKEKAFKKLGYQDISLINAKKLGKESIAFEVHPNLTNNEIKFICNSIIEIADICSIQK